MTSARLENVPTATINHALLFSIVIGAFALASRPCHGFEKRLLLGADVGYSGTFLKDNQYPYIFDGAVFGAHLMYGLSSVLGLSLESAFDWHKDHRTARQDIVETDGELEMGWVSGPMVKKYFLSSMALSVVYAIDVMRVVPYLSLGLTGVRIDRKVDGRHEADHEGGIRWSIGFTYALLEHLCLGAALMNDRLYFGTSNHERRISFVARASLSLGVGKPRKLGLNR